jgi:hypothetical protein
VLGESCDRFLPRCASASVIVLNSRWPVPVKVIVTIGPPVVVSKSCLAPETSLPNSVSSGFFGSVNMYQRNCPFLPAVVWPGQPSVASHFATRY